MNRCALKLILAFALLGLTLTATDATAENVPVFPPGDHPYGHTYPEWAATWWRWALSQPGGKENPIIDPTGASCANGQEGNVWFLAGTSGTAVTRSCTVPPETALLFPIVNQITCEIRDTHPPKQQTEQLVDGPRCPIAQLASELSATIDNFSVSNIGPYCEESVEFEVVLPEHNLFRLPAKTVLDPCSDSGYYLMVRPLLPGKCCCRTSSTEIEA